MTEKITKTQKTSNTNTHVRTGALILMALFAVIVGAYAFWLVAPRGERINHDGYQVVYMASGQAYFGKLKNTVGQYLTLSEPYTAQDVAPSEGQEVTDDQNPSTTLLKVSQQQYGPEDVMSLKSDQVLFWQNLRDDSKVTQAIKNAK